MQSLPTELIITIMALSKSSVLALACTCRRLQSIYKSRELQLLYSILKANPDIKLLMLLVESISIFSSDHLEDASDFETTARLGSRKISAAVARYALRLQDKMEAFCVSTEEVVARSKLSPMPGSLATKETLQTVCYLYVCFDLQGAAFRSDMLYYRPEDSTDEYYREVVGRKVAALNNWENFLRIVEAFAEKDRVARGGLSYYQWRSSSPANAQINDCAVTDEPSLFNARDALNRYILGYYDGKMRSLAEMPVRRKGRKNYIAAKEMTKTRKECKFLIRNWKAKQAVLAMAPCRDLEGFWDGWGGTYSMDVSLLKDRRPSERSCYVENWKEEWDEDIDW